MKSTHTSRQQHLDRRGSRSGPAPHEDLTIAEHLRLLRIAEAGEEGFEFFSGEGGGRLKIPSHLVEQFVHRHGPVHPGDYEDLHGRDWRDDFKALASHAPPIG